MTMKTFLRIAAVLSFLFCAVPGLMLIGTAISTHYRDMIVAVVIGLFFIGMAFFFGAMILVAAERFGRKDEIR